MNAAGGGCFPQTGACTQANPFGPTTAAFCCSSNGSFGSHDCQPGEKHCGLLCYPLAHECCTGDDCTSWGESDGCKPLVSGMYNFCGSDGATCHYCPANQCCSGEGDACEPSDVCGGEFIEGHDNGGGGECTTAEQVPELCAEMDGFQPEYFWTPEGCTCPPPYPFGYEDPGALGGTWCSCFP